MTDVPVGTWRDLTVANAEAERRRLIDGIAPTLAKIAETEAVLRALGEEVEPFRLSPEPEPEPEPAPAAPPAQREEVLTAEEAAEKAREQDRPKVEPEPEPEWVPPEPEPEPAPEPSARAPVGLDEVPEELRAMPAAQTGMALSTRLKVAAQQRRVYDAVLSRENAIADEVADEVGIGKARVSTYLRQLEAAGLVRRTERGARYSQEVLDMRARGRMGGRTTIEFEAVERGQVPAPEPEPEPPAPEPEPPEPDELGKAGPLTEKRAAAAIAYMRESGGKALQADVREHLEINTAATSNLFSFLEQRGIARRTGVRVSRSGRGQPTPEWELALLPGRRPPEPKAREPEPEPEPEELSEAEAIRRVAKVFLDGGTNAKGYRCVAQFRVAKALGGSTASAPDVLREMQRRGLVLSTGQMATASGRGRNAHSPIWRWASSFDVLQSLVGGEAPPAPAPEPEPAEPEPAPPEEELSPTLERVRDAAKQEFGEDQFSPGQLAAKKGWSLDETEESLAALAERGTLEIESPTPDLHLFRWVRPTDPGAAARLDIERRPSEAVSGGNGGRGQTVAGTGRLTQPTDADVRDLVSDVRRQGGQAEPAPSGHWEVKFAGKRVLISGTPRNPRSVRNDRVRLRRIGLAV